MAQQHAKTPDKSSTLDDILAELESRFGSSADKSSAKKPIKKKSFLSSAQSFYAALGLVLLIVGAGIATFLTQRQQDLRQQAAISPYNTCCQLPDGRYVIAADILSCQNGLNGTPVDDNLCGGTQQCDRSGPNTANNSCTNVAPGAFCMTTNGTSGGCVITIEGDITECDCQVTYCDRSDDSECIDVEEGTTCSNGDGQGTCKQIIPGGANGECICVVPATNTPTPLPSIIVSPPATSTPTPGQGGGPTNTPVPPTNTPRPTNTPTPRPTNTPTRTPTPTNTPTPLADLELIKRVSNTSPIVGGIITYTIELTNKGPNDATNIVVADTTLFEALGLEFIPGSLSLSHGTVNYATGEWNIPLLRVNEVATLSADVRVLTVGTKFNQAEVRDVDQEDPDSTPGNIGEPGHEDEDDEDSAVVNPVEPSATATPAPLCLNITMTNPFRGNGEPTQIGDNVTFTCGEVSFAQRYEFRVQLPNGTIVTLNPTASGARISEPFSLSQTGQYKVQCRICNDVAGNFCGEWESL